MDLKTLLLTNVFINNEFIINKLRSKENETLRDLLKDNTPFLPDNASYSQRTYHIYHGLNNYPLCIGNNQITSFISFNQGYRKTCNLSRFKCKCWNDARESSRITMIETNKSGKIRQSLYQKYGVDYSSQIEGVGDKISQSQQNILFGKMKYTGMTLDQLKLLRSLDFWMERKDKSINEISVELSLPNNTINYFSNKLNIRHILKNKRITIIEEKIRQFLLDNDIIFIKNCKSVLSNLELDFYIPDKNIAIEVNGNYWHCELSGNKDRYYHVNKTNLCNEKNIQLIQFTENDIKYKFDIVKSIISNKLNKNSNAIPARKCTIIDLSYNDSKDFLITNHIQGDIIGGIRKGLIYNDKLVACLIANRPRYNKNYDLEILRFCNLLNIRTQGGFSKLIACLPKDLKLISYANRMYSNGNVYNSSNWNLINITPPSYQYTKNYIVFENRTKFQKHKLNNTLDIFDSNKTEWENMMLNGYDRIWDCGNIVFEFKT